MKVNLAYGKTGHIIELPDNLNFDIIEPLWVDKVNDPGYAITKALRDPYNSKSLKDITGKDDKIGIIFSDITRATPYNIIIPPLLDELNGIFLFFITDGLKNLNSRSSGFSFIVFDKKEQIEYFNEFVKNNKEKISEIEPSFQAVSAKNEIERKKDYNPVIDPIFVDRMVKMYEKYKFMK